MKNEELLNDIREKNTPVDEKEMHVSHEKQFQSQKEEFDSELKNKNQKLVEILENNEKKSKIIGEQNVA
ncbi:hypothetical protein TNCV_1022981 [Trichonephila clavipes]|nr:hypothetical protein TNCV_1022981 [Trichonephila clavipes]